jgi:hypothetical protein
MDRTYIDENSTERQRLLALVANLSEDELGKQLPNGLTVAATLAHLAFYDQRAYVLVMRWKQNGVGPSPLDSDATNEALAPLLMAIPPRLAAQLAVLAAEAIDEALEQAPDELIETIRTQAPTFRLRRAKHRQEHLDEIQARLANKD